MYSFLYKIAAFVLLTAPLATLAQTRNFIIDLYEMTESDIQPLSVKHLNQMKYIRSLNLYQSAPGSYFIYADSKESRRPQWPTMNRPSIRFEKLKSASTNTRKKPHNKSKPSGFLQGNGAVEPRPRNIDVSRLGNGTYSVKNTGTHTTSHSVTQNDPEWLINNLLDIEDCMGRRDIRFCRKSKEWRMKPDDARVVPGLTTGFRFINEAWDKAFSDGILGIDEHWSIYAVIMTVNESILWNGFMSPHQVVVGFRLVHEQSEQNLFLQITNWTNDDQQRSYKYCDPLTSAECPFVSQGDDQVDGATKEQWTINELLSLLGIDQLVAENESSMNQK